MDKREILAKVYEWNGCCLEKTKNSTKVQKQCSFPWVQKHWLQKLEYYVFMFRGSNEFVKIVFTYINSQGKQLGTKEHFVWGFFSSLGVFGRLLLTVHIVRLELKAYLLAIPSVKVNSQTYKVLFEGSKCLVWSVFFFLSEVLKLFAFPFIVD